MLTTTRKLFSVKLNSVPVPQNMKLNDFNRNQVYDVKRDKIENLFYKELFPETFKYLNSFKNFEFLTMTKRDFLKVKEASENLHRTFVETTGYVLKKKNGINKLFHISNKDWERISNNFNKTKNNAFYGRMDLGFSFNLNQIKIFEYNTGLCGDIYDTVDFQEAIFNHFFVNNPNRPTNYNEIINSFHSGSKLLDQFAKGWKDLISDCKNKKIYFIHDDDKEEKLVLSSFFKALLNHNINFTIRVKGEGISYDKAKGTLIDESTDEKVDILYKTQPWYIIFKELSKSKINPLYQFFVNKKTKIVEPMWKTVMGNKALLPFVYQRNKNNPYILPCSFDPFDECFGDDEYIIQKGLTSRGSMNTKKIKRSQIKKKIPDVIYQKIFDGGKFKDAFYIMGSYVVRGQHGGMFIKKSTKMINDYSCNIIPTRILI